MNISTIKRVIADQAEEVKMRAGMDLVPREAAEYARKFLDEKIIKLSQGLEDPEKAHFVINCWMEGNTLI